MKNPKIDFVVPVYNVEKYLDSCVKSLLSQTYDNYEIILVDDGSTDLSAEKCDYYADLCKNVRVIHKKNGGLSDARNAGMLAVNGDYVAFVDSDDYIAHNTLECFVECMQKSENVVDIMIGSHIKVSENIYDAMKNEKAKYTFTKEMTGEEYLLESLSSNHFAVTAWSKLYRTQFLRENHFQFKKGVLHEDELYTPQVLLKAEHVIHTDIDFYRYVIREGSIMTSKKQLNNALSVKSIVHELDGVYKNVAYVPLRKCLMDHSATVFYQAISRLGKEEAKDCDLLDYAFLRSHSISFKNKFRYFVVRVKFDLLKKSFEVR